MAGAPPQSKTADSAHSSASEAFQARAQSAAFIHISRAHLTLGSTPLPVLLFYAPPAQSAHLAFGMHPAVRPPCRHDTQLLARDLQKHAQRRLYAALHGRDVGLRLQVEQARGEQVCVGVQHERRQRSGKPPAVRSCTCMPVTHTHMLVRGPARSGKEQGVCTWESCGGGASKSQRVKLRIL